MVYRAQKGAYSELHGVFVLKTFTFVITWFFMSQRKKVAQSERVSGSSPPSTGWHVYCSVVSVHGELFYT